MGITKTLGAVNWMRIQNTIQSFRFKHFNRKKCPPVDYYVTVNMLGRCSIRGDSKDHHHMLKMKLAIQGSSLASPVFCPSFAYMGHYI